MAKKKKKKRSAAQRAAARRNIKKAQKALRKKHSKPRRKSKSKTKVKTMAKRRKTRRRKTRKTRGRGKSTKGLGTTGKVLLASGGAILAAPVVAAAAEGKLPDPKVFVDDVVNRGKEALGNITEKKYAIPGIIGIGLMTQKIPKVKKSHAAAVGLALIAGTVALAATNPAGVRNPGPDCPPNRQFRGPNFQGNINVTPLDRRR